MKTRIMLRSVFFPLLALLMLGGCATAKSSPKSIEEMSYGTWINKSNAPQKTVRAAGTWKDYQHASDPMPFREATEQIVDRWTDSQGVAWLKTSDELVSPPDQKGIKFYSLLKISKSGTVLEYVWATVDFNSKYFPATVAPGVNGYNIYYRAGG